MTKKSKIIKRLKTVRKHYINTIRDFPYASHSDENLCKVALAVWGATENATSTLVDLFPEVRERDMSLDQKIVYLGENMNALPSGVTGNYFEQKRILHDECNSVITLNLFSSLNRNAVIDEINYAGKFLDNIEKAVEKKLTYKE